MPRSRPTNEGLLTVISRRLSAQSRTMMWCGDVPPSPWWLQVESQTRSQFTLASWQKYVPAPCWKCKLSSTFLRRRVCASGAVPLAVALHSLS